MAGVSYPLITIHSSEYNMTDDRENGWLAICNMVTRVQEDWPLHMARYNNEPQSLGFPCFE